MKFKKATSLFVIYYIYMYYIYYIIFRKLRFFLYMRKLKKMLTKSKTNYESFKLDGYNIRRWFHGYSNTKQYKRFIHFLDRLYGQNIIIVNPARLPPRLRVNNGRQRHDGETVFPHTLLAFLTEDGLKVDFPANFHHPNNRYTAIYARVRNGIRNTTHGGMRARERDHGSHINDANNSHRARSNIVNWTNTNGMDNSDGTNDIHGTSNGNGVVFNHGAVNMNGAANRNMADNMNWASNRNGAANRNGAVINHEVYNSDSMTCIYDRNGIHNGQYVHNISSMDTERLEVGLLDGRGCQVRRREWIFVRVHFCRSQVLFQVKKSTSVAEFIRSDEFVRKATATWDIAEDELVGMVLRQQDRVIETLETDCNLRLETGHLDLFI